jgi:ABC-type branched-subunit amino acid transport system ATPase component
MLNGIIQEGNFIEGLYYDIYVSSQKLSNVLHIPSFKDMEPRARDQAKHIIQMLQVYETHHSRDTTNSIREVRLLEFC